MVSDLSDSQPPPAPLRKGRTGLSLALTRAAGSASDSSVVVARPGLEGISTRLKILVELRGAGAIAEALGVSVETLRRYQHGRGKPNGIAASRLCTKLRVSANWLVFGDGPIWDTGSKRPEPLPLSVVITELARRATSA